jgi:spore maturation protein A
MLNYIWLFIIIVAVFCAAGSDLHHVFTSDVNDKTVASLTETTRLGQVSQAAMEAAGTAVKISIGLIGVMAFWLGIMKVAEEAGFTRFIARMVKPVIKFLFPRLPQDHPAISAMIMNIAASMLGLSNAATPLGLKAMEELNKINPRKDEASDDMCTFLVINTSAITLIPATAIAIRASMDSVSPQMIIIPSILAATCATIVGLTVVKLVQLRNKKRGDKTNAVV